MPERGPLSVMLCFRFRERATFPSVGVPSRAAVHVDHLSGDVARQRRSQKGHQHGQVVGLADVAGRTVLGHPLALGLGRRQEPFGRSARSECDRAQRC